MLSSREGFALYFSRLPIPYSKISPKEASKNKAFVGELHIDSFAKLSADLSRSGSANEGITQAGDSYPISDFPSPRSWLVKQSSRWHIRSGLGVYQTVSRRDQGTQGLRCSAPIRPGSQR